MLALSSARALRCRSAAKHELVVPENPLEGPLIAFACEVVHIRAAAAVEDTP